MMSEEEQWPAAEWCAFYFLLTVQRGGVRLKAVSDASALVSDPPANPLEESSAQVPTSHLRASAMRQKAEYRVTPSKSNSRE
jgi:hypothetical protein